MCGRFNIISDPLTQMIMEIVAGQVTIKLETQYNIAPTQQVPVLLKSAGGEWLVNDMRWWLVPYWSSEPSSKYSMFNARSEGLASSRAYQEPFKRRRCIVPASSYYEWAKQGGQKVPYLIAPERDSGFAFAGLWDRWEKQGQVIESCTIITGAAPAGMIGIHNRIPIHLSKHEIDQWLDASASAQDLTALLDPVLKFPVLVTPVSSYVGNSRNKDERCVEPLGEPIVIQ
ncbi:MAG: SOS response-associated peptidase [Pseudomonadales bacterium]|nr:SOS response-associated peptidase [Pseudomonadales bacterium]MDG1443273.1 SOS response-associated peptidase [Pseudomonadales bacterium]